MDTFSTNSCAMCKFSIQVEGDPSGYLECHRHAICAVGIDCDGDVVSAFPVCEPSMWCGEHELVYISDWENIAFDGLKAYVKPKSE